MGLLILKNIFKKFSISPEKENPSQPLQEGLIEKESKLFSENNLHEFLRK